MTNLQFIEWLDSEIAETTKFRKHEDTQPELNYWLGASDALDCAKRKFLAIESPSSIEGEEKRIAIKFGTLLLCDYEISVFPNDPEEQLCWQLAGTNQRYTTEQLFDGLVKEEYFSESPSHALPIKEEEKPDRDWEAKEIRKRIDEQKHLNDGLAERAFVLGYFNRPDPPASYVDDIADGNLKEAWERCKPELLSSPTPIEQPKDQEVPFDVCNDIYKMWQANTQGFFFPPYQAGAIAMYHKMYKEVKVQKEKQTHLVSELKVADNTIASFKKELERQTSLKNHCLKTMDDQTKTREKLEAELTALRTKVQELQEWHDSHI